MAFYAIYWLDNPDVSLWTRLWGYNYFGEEKVAHIKTGTDGVFGALLLENNLYTLILLSHEPKTFDISYEAGTVTAYTGLTMTSGQYSDVYYHSFSRHGDAAYSHYLDIYSSLDDMLLAFSRHGKTNPYAPGGTSGPGGGAGTYVMNYDSVPFPELPALSAVNTGFASIWVPELSEVQALATYMWNCDFTTLDFWKKLAADPLDLILGFYIFPVQLVPDGAENVTIGIINTGVSMHYRNSQYVDVDCGTVQLEEYWKAYLDYSPYTRISIYLPYIGVRPLNIDDVMGRSISLRYRIDLASGACVAMLRVDGSETEQDREAVLYQFTGFCATQIPVTSVQMGDLVRSTVSLVASVAGAVTGGASLGDVASSAANLATTKPDIAHSGAIGSAAGLMGVQRPYLIIERPRQAVPEEQQHYTGFPSFITEELSELEGYTEVEAVHLHDLGCTENEAREIERLLMEGVIF